MKIPLSPPPISRLMRDCEFERLAAILDGRPDLPVDGYLHWDQIRHREPPGDLTHDEWWLVVKFGRIQNARRLSLTDAEGRAFHLTVPDRASELLHLIDSDARGHVASDSRVATEEVRDRFVMSSLIEEAITSSQLEGASTTRRVAAQMLRSGRRPGNRSERMIFNNFLAMQRVRELARKPLSAGVVCELHAMICDGTLDDSADAGRLQTAKEDRVTVHDNRDGTLLHTPPPADSLPDRLEAMCAFANATDGDERFLHPVVRAIVLHFWLAYDHPFVDGNGRTARLLFYWAALRSGYWLVEFLSISRLLRKAPAKYARAFLYCETDDNDVTYFLLHQLEMIRHAIAALYRYLDRKAKEIRDLERQLKDEGSLNYRQRALVAHALRHPGNAYTIESHRRSHSVVYATARADLLDLVDRQLLHARKAGRRLEFVAPGNPGTRG